MECQPQGVLDALTNGATVSAFLPFEKTRNFFPWRPLSVSPIGVAAFFNGAALPILLNEFLWVWLPSGALALMLGRIFRARTKT